MLVFNPLPTYHTHTHTHAHTHTHRDLVSGAETLKTVAEILMFIDSIAEVKDGTKS